MIIAVIILGLCSLLMFGIGISNIKAQEPAKFYTGEKGFKVDELTDVKAWNRKHGIMWIIYGVILFVVNLIGMMISNVGISMIVCLLGTVVPIPIMMWYHTRLIKLYKNEINVVSYDLEDTLSRKEKACTMTDMKQVHDFATKWYAKFNDENIDYIELVDYMLARDCENLGFEMDCGKAFSEKYDKANKEVNALKEIINNVTDISLLGSAIYSQWRYYNHWAYDAKEILEPKNREWFIIALQRLAELSSED